MTLLQKDGNQKVRQTLFLSWRRSPFRVGLSARSLGDFYQNSLTLDDGTLYWIPSVTTWNGTFDYNWDMADRDWRLRLGINNLFDKRAPLADRYFGFFRRRPPGDRIRPQLLPPGPHDPGQLIPRRRSAAGLEAAFELCLGVRRRWGFGWCADSPARHFPGDA